MHVVEVHRDGDGLVEPMAQIRTWLDHERIQPNVFRLSLIAGGMIFVWSLARRARRKRLRELLPDR